MSQGETRPGDEQRGDNLWQPPHSIEGTLDDFSERVCNAASSVAENFGITEELRILRGGPPSWVFVDGDIKPVGLNHMPSVAIRLTYGDDSSLLAKAREEIELVQTLRHEGAQVQEFLGQPEQSHGFVATVSRYLPGELVDYVDFGEAVASLHNAGRRIKVPDGIDPFQPLLRTRETYEYLTDLAQKNETFRIGAIDFPQELLELFGEALWEGEETAKEMLRLSTERGYPLTVMQQDTHIKNARIDHKGMATLTDLDCISIGPAEYGLGRLDQWARRFERPFACTRQFMKGYERIAERMLDPELLALATHVANLRYATSLVTHSVEAFQRGHPIKEWSLHEGVERLANLHSPNFQWESREAYLETRP